MKNLQIDRFPNQRKTDMQHPGYNSNAIKLLEGESFPFKVHSLVRLQDDAYYFVLQDVNGMKHFLPAIRFQHFGLVIGNEITCRIDKINCTGRIFLVPQQSPMPEMGESQKEIAIISTS